jgi:hypothetical protein
VADLQIVLTPTLEHRKRESSMEPCPPLLPKANVARRRIVQPPREVTAAPDDIGFRFFKDVFVHPYFCWSYRAFRRCQNASARRWQDAFHRPSRPGLFAFGCADRSSADDRASVLRRGRQRSRATGFSPGRHRRVVEAGRHLGDRVKSAPEGGRNCKCHDHAGLWHGLKQESTRNPGILLVGRSFDSQKP